MSESATQPTRPAVAHDGLALYPSTPLALDTGGVSSGIRASQPRPLGCSEAKDGAGRAEGYVGEHLPTPLNLLYAIGWACNTAAYRRACAAAGLACAICLMLTGCGIINPPTACNVGKGDDAPWMGMEIEPATRPYTVNRITSTPVCFTTKVNASTQPEAGK